MTCSRIIPTSVFRLMASNKGRRRPTGRCSFPVPRSPRFRKSLFSKKAGAIVHTKAVVHTYLHNKEWLPEVSDRWKMFRSHPAMFRVQVERMGGGLALEHDPNESLLKELIVEINRRVAEKSDRDGTTTTKLAMAPSK